MPGNWSPLVTVLVSAYGGEECELRGLQQMVGVGKPRVLPRKARLLSVVPPSVWGSKDIGGLIVYCFPTCKALLSMYCRKLV